MLTTGIQNLPEPLAWAQAAYHDRTARLAPASADRLARRMQHFASSVQFVLDDPDAARRLHALTKDLRTVPRLGTPLPQVLQGAMALVGGDFGNIQIVDPATGSLRLITQAGFGPEFLDYFAVVEDVHSTCRRAARQGAQTAVADVRADPGFTPRREIAAAAGIPRGPVHAPGRLCRSPDRHGLDALPAPAPPVRSGSAGHGAVCGFRRRVADQAPGPGERWRSACSGRPGDGLGPALLDPARVREADVSVPFEFWVMGRMTASFARRAGRRGPSAQPV